jgi:hypothetical protein
MVFIKILGRFDKIEPPQKDILLDFRTAEGRAARLGREGGPYKSGDGPKPPLRELGWAT